MKNLTPEEKLKQINIALKHFFDVDIEQLLLNYQRYLEKKAELDARPKVACKEDALEYFNCIPENCYNDKALKEVADIIKSYGPSRAYYRMRDNPDSPMIMRRAA